MASTSWPTDPARLGSLDSSECQNPRRPLATILGPDEVELITSATGGASQLRFLASPGDEDLHTAKRTYHEMIGFSGWNPMHFGKAYYNRPLERDKGVKPSWLLHAYYYIVCCIVLIHACIGYHINHIPQKMINGHFRNRLIGGTYHIYTYGLIWY